MPEESSQAAEIKLLPDESNATAPATPDAPPPSSALAPATSATAPAIDGRAATAGIAPPRQLGELPRDELAHLAEEFGLDPTVYKQASDLVRAIHERRQMIGTLDRDAMLDVIRWSRRPVTANATREQIAQEIARIRSMRFAGLSHRGLVVLARIRGAEVSEADPIPTIIKKLRKREGFFQKLARKRRAVVGSMVMGLIGHADSSADYQFLPDQTSPGVAPPRTSSLKEDIEEAGLIGGITSRLKKTADAYLNQKLDEIESRIDRKLDEIDRRLADWRDKEIANRIRILKITLWASVIVGIASLIYSYITVVLFPRPTGSPPPSPSFVQPRSGNSH